MTTSRTLPGRDYDALKMATRQLVKLAGGPTEAARLTRGCQSRVSEAISFDHPDRFLALDQIADLEAETGQPIVTRALAGLSEFDLSSHDLRSDDRKSMSSLLVDVVTNSGQMCRDAGQAIATGHTDPKELSSLIATVDAALNALNALSDALRGR
jgi:hypothetical protein